MPSTRWHAGTGFLAVLVVAYATLVVGELLLGVITAGLVYLFGWLVALVSPERMLADMGTTRATVTAVVSLVTLLYAVVVATQLLLGVFVVALVVLVSWTTAPNGPIVRGVRWIRAVRDDLHAIRVATESDHGASNHGDATAEEER